MAADFAHPTVSGSSRRSLILLLLLCGWLYFLNLGAIPFLGKDEPKNAEALREMMARGDWVTTTLREKPWFDKPILYYWASLVFFHLIGPGEMAARLAPALFGLGGVLLTWRLARKLFDEKTALRAGIVLATALEYFWFSRTAVVDVPLTFCVALSLAAFYLALEGPADSSALWYRTAFAAAGGAVLAKGPVGIVLPGLVVGTYLLAGRRRRESTRIPWVSSILCFLLAAGPWYAVVSIRHGRQFWDDFVLNRNLNRYLTTIHHHPGPVYYYLPVLILGLFPWGAVLPFAVVKFLREGWRDLLDRRRHVGYLMLWVLMPLLFFSLAGSKLPSYLLPCFPALAILVARGWGEILEPDDASRALRTGAIGSLLLVFPILAAGIYLWCRSEAPEQIPAQLPLAGALAATAVALALAAAAGRRRLLFPLCAGGTFLCLTALVAFSLGDVRETASLDRIARVGVVLNRAGATVVAYRNFHNYLYFYTEDRVPLVNERAELDHLLREKEMVFCYLEKDGWKELNADPGVSLEVAARQHKIILARVRLVRCEGRP